MSAGPAGNKAMARETLTIVAPIFNDWASFRKLVEEIDGVLDAGEFNVSVVAVDDGSSEPLPDMSETFSKLTTVGRVEVLHLAHNLGHQRAIAIGLSYAERNCKSDLFIIMDADGEDRPDTIPDLIRELRASDRIVFARRTNRQENGVFLLFYGIYRFLFHMLTGQRIGFGNYCAIPGSLIRRVVFLPELWNHFAAGIMRSGLPHKTLVIPRGPRYFGKSRMNFVGLVLHGLSAISVYTDILAVRLILFTAAIIFGSIFAGFGLLYVRYFTELAIPGWATTVALGLIIILFQALMFLSLISFLILNARSAHPLIPALHYDDFLLARQILHERG